ncbi:GNAT family N-acetyltransferase [Pontivivens ytuae]|uniref:GNAT family N-acetyltransferase n=1 Tax=Pontivivens ytuae TaxID=2789856 RepID=A0A7S9LTW0_9RHOB|nr:GNAT family N-acetyltransferase [Pontivivens ytuae]QPH54925.1 GNAT family N-acetyltransferase [Pontivivens ytuae]
MITRQAAPDEADAVASIARASRAHFLPYLPVLHSPEEDRAHFRGRVFSKCEVWVAEGEAGPIGFCAFREGWIDHLYLLPPYVGRSIGTALLNRAKDRHAYLQLWVFQQNSRAIRFYERNGFRKVRETDGASNEEKVPDALYEWHLEP